MDVCLYSLPFNSVYPLILVQKVFLWHLMCAYNECGSGSIFTLFKFRYVRWGIIIFSQTGSEVGDAFKDGSDRSRAEDI